jgi:hypothetical protein
MVERERMTRARVEAGPRREAPPPQHALLALQRAAGNRAVGRMLQRQHDPDFRFGGQTAEAISVGTQQEMNDAVEELIEDRYGGVRQLWLKNDVAKSVGQWRDLIFSFMEETYTLKNGMGVGNVQAAVKAVKKKHRADALRHAANVWVYTHPDGVVYTADAMTERLIENGVYLDEDDDGAIERIVETEGAYAQKKVEVAAGNRELIDEDEIVVILDDHQNKHQRSKIIELKQYSGEPGSKFARGKDLDWHTDNTAEVVKGTIEQAVSDGILSKDVSYSPPKRPIDGITYDLTISWDADTGKWVGSYHCNPVDDERWAIDGGDAEEET